MSSIGSDVKVLEHSTLKVPYEVLNKKFRAAQKVLDREAAYVSQAGCEIEKILADMPPVSISPANSSSNDISVVQGNDYDSILIGNDGLTEEISGRLIGISGDTEAMIDDNSESNSNSNATDKSSESIDNDKCKLRGPKGTEVAKLLGTLVERLTSLKRKAGESIQDELEAARAVRKRVQHLKSYANVDVDPCGRINPNLTNSSWKRSRLNRMLVDHLLREGMYDTARLLAEDLGIKELTNLDVFWAAKEVEESLKRYETNRMVAWCYENKSKLRKIRSVLELEIRVQEFVELVRSGRRGDAVKHARKYLADSEGPEHITAVKKCMGLLAFPTNTNLTPYADLLSPDRWQHLISYFRQEHARLYQLAPTSVLGAVVQAGLASLKTPQCYRTNSKNTNCPVCTEPLSTLASALPYAHCAHSQLVCAISGEPLNENNPPLVLPSGFVYGTKSLEETARTNSGKVICSRSGKVFHISEAEKVYVM